MEEIRAFKIVRKLIPVPFNIATVVLQAHLPVENKDSKIVFEGLRPPVNKTGQQEPKGDHKENPDNTA